MTSWSMVFPFNPKATPRPDFAITKKGVITYYGADYSGYLSAIQSYLKNVSAYNERFEKTVTAKYGVIANIIFYIGIPDKFKQITKLTHTSKADIDNLIKAILDGIFNGLKVRDSRIVGVKALKLRTATNPRTEITLTGLSDIEETVESKVASKVTETLNEVQQTKTDDWSVILPYNPVATPRPAFTFKKVGVRKNGKPKYKEYTYNSTKYEKYLNQINNYLIENNMYNSQLSKVTNSEYGVVANVNFYCQVPKNQKNIRKILKTTAPDIDNLLKAILDGIFNNITADDSRVVGVQALKFNVLNNARTEITLSGLTRMIA